jgi:hypothetical protein
LYIKGKITNTQKTVNGTASQGRERKLLLSLIVLLIIAIAAAVWFGLLPRYRAHQTPDLSDNTWIEQLQEEKITLFNKDFYDACSVTYSPDQVTLNVRYFSKAPLSEVREKYKALLDNPAEFGDNTDLNMNLSGKLNGLDVSISSYYFEMITQIYDVKIILEKKEGESLRAIIEKNYPIRVLEANSMLKAFTGEEYGGYVLYNYDEFDQYLYPDIPIYSRAYHYGGTTDDFDAIAAVLATQYEDSHWNQPLHVLDYRDGENNITLGYIEGQKGNLVMINVQTTEKQK